MRRIRPSRGEDRSRDLEGVGPGRKLDSFVSTKTPRQLRWRVKSTRRASIFDVLSRASFRSRRLRQLFAWRSDWRTRPFAGLDARAHPKAERRTSRARDRI